MTDRAGELDKFDNNEGLARYRRYSLWVTRRRAKEISAQIKNNSGAIIEIGCGPGYLISELNKKLPQGCPIYGLDIDENMLRFAGSRISAGKRKTGFIRNPEDVLPFKDGSVSMVISEYSMHHWVYPERMLQELYRVLAPGGEAMIFDFYPETAWYRIAVHMMTPLFLFKRPPYRNQLMKFIYAYYSSLRQSYTRKELSVMLNNASVKSYQIATKRMTLKLKILKPPQERPGQP